MKKLLCLIFSILFVMNANAADSALEKCLKKITADEVNWNNGISQIFGNTDLDESNVEVNKSKIYDLLTNRFESLCGTELMAIAKTSAERGQINFKHNNKDYAFNFSVDKLFDNFGIQTGILVINKRNLHTNEILEKDSLPKSTSKTNPYRFFSDECSDHAIWDNLDDDAAVNQAGQAIFTEYGGSANEFFIDFAVGDDNRAFPGLIIEDVTYSTEERVVSYTNLKTAIERTRQFANKLKGGSCSNQQLSVYLVALNVQKQTQNTSSQSAGWRDVTATSTGIAAGVGAGTAIASSLGLIAAGSATIPVAGWIVAGVAGVAAIGFALWPTNIANIERVMILDGPYDL